MGSGEQERGMGEWRTRVSDGEWRTRARDGGVEMGGGDSYEMGSVMEMEKKIEDQYRCQPHFRDKEETERDG